MQELGPARLATNDLACRRGDRVLFRGLNLSLGPGDLLHVTGANGIGKSSLLRILAGLLSPFAGSVEQVGSMALLDERPALDPEMPLGKALGFWAQIDGVGYLALESCVDRLGLGDLLDVPVRYLSTGQRKRAALARMLGQQAQIWLLDEPLSGLDEASRELVATLVAQHTLGGGIAVLASHQPLPVENCSFFALAEYVP